MNEKHQTMLAQLRKASGLTQAQVADTLGVSKATYSSWETGRAELGAERVLALSGLFGCTPNDVLGYGTVGGRERFVTLTREEEEVVLLWRSLAPNVRDDLLDIMRSTVKGWRIK